MTCKQVEELRQLRKEREEWRKERAELSDKLASRERLAAKGIYYTFEELEEHSVRVILRAISYADRRREETQEIEADEMVGFLYEFIDKLKKEND